MTNWFWSDLHIGHGRVADLRAFPSTRDHDDWLAQNWDRTVGPGDVVWILGDLCVSGRSYALDWIAQRRGVKHLIVGNHDDCHPMHRGAHKVQGFYLDEFASVAPFQRMRLAGHEFLMSHFPYKHNEGLLARGDDRHHLFQYYLPDMGMPLLHGHTHSNRRWMGRQMHVGVDAWNTPVREDVVINWLRSLGPQAD